MARITRRDFVAGSAITAGLVSLAACGNQQQAAEGVNKATEEVAAEEVAGDIYAAPDASAYPIDPDGDGVAAIWSSEDLSREGWTRVANGDGPTLGVADTAKIIQVNGLAFKDLNGNGKLDLYEDWRQPVEARAAALAGMLSIEEVAPLKFHGDLSMSGSTLSDEQVAMVEAGQRAGVLRGGASGDNYAVGIGWNNDIQSRCEAGAYGIPYWNSTDAYRFWNLPSCLTIAATFDPENARKTANYLSMGWRSVGITCELGPEVDVASNPVYSRFSGCFSDDPLLSSDMGRAYADGLQSTWEGDEDQGWGPWSVSAMFKHYPGDATCEGGRNSHNATGKYAVYPNDNLGVGLVPYFLGGMNLEGKTGQIAAIMPNYAIVYTDDKHFGDNVATAYNEYVLQIMREAGWDGVITTDWQITQEEYFNGAFPGRHFGVDNLTPEERIALGYKAGTDQFGGEFQGEEIPAVIDLVKADLGEEGALENYRESARRFFIAMLNVGLFENPYLDLESTKAVWEGDVAAEAAAFADELLPKCVVMLKNKGGLIKKSDGSKPTVYVPMVFSKGGGGGPFAPKTDPEWKLPADQALLEQFFTVITDTVGEPTGQEEVTETFMPGAVGGPGAGGPGGDAPDAGGDAPADEAEPAEPEIKIVYTENDIIRASAEDVAAADFVLVVVSGPTIGEGCETAPDGTVTYLPMNLQYNAYTADGANVRKESIGGVDEFGVRENRSYFGNTNPGDLTELNKILDAKKLAGDKPIVVAISSGNPMIFSEFEGQVDVILYTPAATDGASIAKIVAGEIEPSGLLPYQMPKDMDTVEANAEDTPRDLDPYVDSEGNAYDFAFGLNWSGVIDDERTAKYKVAPILSAE